MKTAYLTDTKTFVRKFDGERWAPIPDEEQAALLAEIAAHRISLIWRINLAEFYR